MRAMTKSMQKDNQPHLQLEQCKFRQQGSILQPLEWQTLRNLTIPNVEKDVE